MQGDAWANIEKLGFDKGLRKGLEEGRLEGRLEGRHDAARAALDTVAAARFGRALETQLEQVPDARLQEAIAAVASAPDAEQAAERLRGL